MTEQGIAYFDTGVGRCAIVWSDLGVTGVRLPEVAEAATAHARKAGSPPPRK